MRTLVTAVLACTLLCCVRSDVVTPPPAPAATPAPVAAAPVVRLEEGRSALRTSQSAWLRAAADAPVPWQVYAPSVFATAQASGRLVLVNVGAGWCTGCRAMDAEAFSHPATVALLKEQFVPVKVDADERPDVESRLQAVAMAMGATPGLPLTVVISPDGLPLFAGNALPAVGDSTYASLLDTLSRLLSDFRGGSPILREVAARGAKRLTDATPVPPQADQPPWRTALAGLAAEFDDENGGLKGAPKVLTPRLWELAAHAGREWGDHESLDRAVRSLTSVCRGGVRDIVGGGFSRMTRDAAWSQPSFDKHVVTNALMLDALLAAHAVTGSAQLRACAQGVLQWVAEDLIAAAGLTKEGELQSLMMGTSVAPHAGSGLVGETQTFTVAEVQAALPEAQARVAQEVFGLLPRPQSVPGLPLRNVPRLVVAVGEPPYTEAAVEEVRRALNTMRRARPRPDVDRVSYAGPTALMLHAMLRSAPVLGMAPPRMLALEVLNTWIRHGHRKGGGFSHGLTPTAGAFGVGTLLDQAAMIRALVLAHAQTGELRYLQTALETAEVVHLAYARPSGGYAESLAEDGEPPVLAERRASAVDALLPSAGAEMALALLDLADVLGRGDLRERAAAVLGPITGEAQKLGPHAPSVALAAWRLTHPPIQVTVVDRQLGKGTVALTDAAFSVGRLGTAVVHMAPRKEADKGTTKPRAVACVAAACGKPTDDPEALKRDVKSARPAAL